MISIKLRNINFGEKTIQLEKGYADELIKKLELNDDSVILIGKDGKIFTKDEKINDNEEINVIEVFSGG